ncbi:HER063Wp [Eremothecium sinecaudum]|uniref:HER063Wp n=1 Tax=Eremothecium sinecaudum TaxID=45286 RepID=A0A0X8HTT8_9SACH|nr:HER063Wp [Eremothecium sinecaudum]AMD21342.1 HER063Wp [Eremothecium sinecaudum]
MVFWTSKTGIEANYSYAGTPSFAVEPWLVYTGRPRSASANPSTKVSVFIFDKKKFEANMLSSKIVQSKSLQKDRQFINATYDMLRNQVNNLARLKHPKIVTLVAPLEEHAKTFMFVTEYVSGSLLTAYQKSAAERDLLNLPFHELIIHRGILQISHALDFIHNTAAAVVLDLQPSSILITENMDWKIFGLSHLIRLPPNKTTSEYSLPQYKYAAPAFLRPNHNFLAPEAVLSDTISPKSDYFSLGMLIYYLYFGKTLMNCSSHSVSCYKEEYSKYHGRLLQLSWATVFSNLPDKLRCNVSKLMNRDVFSRYENITRFIDSDFFQDAAVKSMMFLDNLAARSDESKIVYFEGLVKLLPKFPLELLQKKFLPILLQVFDQSCSIPEPNAYLIKTNLNIIVEIGLSLSKLSFNEKITPLLLEKNNLDVVVKNAPSCLIENLETFNEKLKPEAFSEGILRPLISHVLKLSGVHSIDVQELLLGKIHLILDTLDYTTARRFFFPLVSELFARTTSLTVKIACINTFHEMVERRAIDKPTIVEELVPLMRAMKTRDSRVLMKFLELFKSLPDCINDDETVVFKLLPLIWNYSMADTLTLSQYLQYTETINKISQTIQNSHMEVVKTNSKQSNEIDSFEALINREAADDPDDFPDEETETVAVTPLQPKKAPKKPHVNSVFIASPSSIPRFDSPAFSSPSVVPSPPPPRTRQGKTFNLTTAAINNKPQLIEDVFDPETDESEQNDPAEGSKNANVYNGNFIYKSSSEQKVNNMSSSKKVENFGNSKKSNNVSKTNRGNQVDNTNTTAIVRANSIVNNTISNQYSEYGPYNQNRNNDDEYFEEFVYSNISSPLSLITRRITSAPKSPHAPTSKSFGEDFRNGESSALPPSYKFTPLQPHKRITSASKAAPYSLL